MSANWTNLTTRVSGRESPSPRPGEPKCPWAKTPNPSCRDAYAWAILYRELRQSDAVEWIQSSEKRWRLPFGEQSSGSQTAVRVPPDGTANDFSAENQNNCNLWNSVILSKSSRAVESRGKRDLQKKWKYFITESAFVWSKASSTWFAQTFVSLKPSLTPWKGEVNAISQIWEKHRGGPGVLWVCAAVCLSAVFPLVTNLECKQVASRSAWFTSWSGAFSSSPFYRHGPLLK